jgi:TetR/AcrR family transcriptional regulator, tetracycline repressor protein
MARRSKNDPDAPELDLDGIVRAAIELIDANGLDEFSLRALARYLGAGNMSLYYYVKDRDQLLALVLDEILGSINLTRLPREPVDALALLSKRFINAFAAHPHVIPLFVLQPIYSIGPNALAVFDRFVELLRDTGLPARSVADTTVALVEYLCGHLIGYMPHMRPPGHDHSTTVDDILQAVPDDAAPNLRAVGRELRRAVATLQPSVGINLLLAGLHPRPTHSASTAII